MKQSTSRVTGLVAMALVAALVTGCTSTPSPSTTAPTSTLPVITSTTEAVAPGTTPVVVPAVTGGPTPRLFNVNLSEGVVPALAPVGAAAVKGDELDPNRITELVSKLPKWDDPAALTTPFAWPTQSSPPPRAGATVAEKFPPSTQSAPPAVDSGPLKVLRVQPEGAVPIAPYLAITFNQPMVPVGTVGQVAPGLAPVKLSPDIPGRWQWIGTRTLRFDVDEAAKVDRLPMATSFTATVPAGTKSATGSTLATEASFTFSTPAPKVETFNPTEEGLPLQPVFVATFNQRIDPGAVLATIALDAGGTAAPVRLATPAEVAADERAKNITANAQEGRWLAFRPVRPLPTATSFVVSVGPGTPSAEGPVTTTTAERFTGRTFGPLTVVGVSCQFGDECPPGTGFTVQFSNPIDASAVGTKAANVSVEPPLAAQAITVNGGVFIEGRSLARTKYTVTIPVSFTDVFGQKLGADVVKTITTGSATKSLRPLEILTTLDPFAKDQKLSVLTTNLSELRVRVFEADPTKFGEYVEYLNQRNSTDVEKPIPNWKVLADSNISPKPTNDATVETLVDLGPALGGKPGQVIVLIEPLPKPRRDSNEYWELQPTFSWVQSTTMALDSFADGKELRVWATDLRTGAPIPELEVTTPDGQTAMTKKSGLATLKLDVGSATTYVRGTRGAESFILPVGVDGNSGGTSLRFYTFDDRQMYRPGETISVKGWARLLDVDSGSINPSGLTKLSYAMTDANGVELTTGSVPVGALGGFDLKLEIPKTANLGPASISLSTLEGAVGSGQHQFQIAEFRRPEFEVNVEPITATPFVSTAPVTMSTTASYFAGGPLPNAPAQWAVSTSETTFSPIGWDAFTFGIFRPWWWAEDFDSGFVTRGRSSSFESRSGPGGFSNAIIKEYSGTTDGSGRHGLQLDFTGENGVLPDLPVSVSVAGTVTDVNRQAWADQRSILVHSADRYVGLRSDRSFVKQGDPLNVEVVATDIDGKAIAGSQLKVTAGLVRSKFENGKYIDEIVDPQNCVVTGATAPVACKFETPVGGQYRISSTIADAKGGRNRSELTVWVSGAESQPARGVEQETLTIVPDKKEYAAGEVAKVFVQAPFAKAEGLMIVTHGNRVREAVKFTAPDGSTELTIPITEADVPSLSATIELVGAADRVGFDGVKVTGAPQRPAYAVGSLRLSVPPKKRTLTVSAKPADPELAPGGSTSIAVAVNDASGAPVQGAEFAVVVVDEAVLGLSDYKLPNPIEIFYDGGYDALRTAYGRTQVRLLDPELLAASPTPGRDERFQNVSNTLPGGALETVAAAPAASEAAADFAGEPKKAKLARAKGIEQEGGDATVSVRSNFDALALFQPTVVTDASGKANVDVKLPDNLTRYRVMVVAASGNDRFGTAESNITARLPLSVRPSAPRFLNTGDQFEFPVVLQNLDNVPMNVDVVVQAANLDLTGALGRRVRIPAGDRIEVRFPAKVRSAGTARARITAFAGSASDSAEVSIPVFTPGTAEAFATYGTLDSGAVRQPLLAPTEVVESFGGLEISTSSTSLQALTDALLYVDEYDYKSSDAYASRIMSISALRGVLKDFAVSELPSEAQLNAAVERDIAGLEALQNDDGGWSYWRKYERSEPYNSVHAAHALVLAKQAGFAVSANTLERALNYVANVENVIPPTYSEFCKDTIRAYAIWVEALAGRRNPNKAAALLRQRGDKLNLDALAWIWGSVDAANDKARIERTITNRAVDTAGAVSFTNGVNDGDYLTLTSDRRTDALVLDALISNAPKSDLVEKVVAGLMASKTRGRWSNMQENTFALLAFKNYYDTYESVTPNFVAKAWIGEQFAGERAFKGRTTERSTISVPMKTLIEGGNRDLIVAKDGSGRLYYRIGLRYVPADLTLDALDRGFVVDRLYEGVDKKSDVLRDADGTWRIKAGAKVRVKLTLVAESQRTHVALIDPLPAGLEALNPDLAVTQPVVSSPDDAAVLNREWWWGNWYDFQQFRDDRSEAFSTFLPAGVYNYSYVARATTPGSFIVPPTRAEEMYAPETFGRTSTDKVVITSP
jgi:alpha-2-macroglobulin